jgi:hypothetical protein
MTSLKPGTPVRIHPDKNGPKAHPKPGKVRSYWRGPSVKFDLVTVDYDDGSPPDVVPPESVEAVR